MSMTEEKAVGNDLSPAEDVRRAVTGFVHEFKDLSLIHI